MEADPLETNIVTQLDVFLRFILYHKLIVRSWLKVSVKAEQVK